MPQLQPVFELPVAEPDAQKPWERQENEPARWFLRFRNYLKMGPRRTVNAVFERERQEKAGKPTNKAGTRWYEAAHRWQWEARSEAYDAHVDEEKAKAMQAVAAAMPFASRPFRVTQLNSLAMALMRKTEEGLPLPAFVACVKTMQSLLHDIAEEVAPFGMALEQIADSAAFMTWSLKNLRLEDLERERTLDQEAEIDRMLVQYEAIQKRG